MMSTSEEKEDKTLLSEKIDVLEKRVSELEKSYMKVQEEMRALQQDINGCLRPVETEVDATEPQDEKEGPPQEISMSGTESLPETDPEQPEILKKISPEPEPADEYMEESAVQDATGLADEHPEESAEQAAPEQEQSEPLQPNQEENAMTTSEDQIPAQEESKALEDTPAGEQDSEFEVEALIAGAQKKEEAQFEEDRQQYTANLEEVRYWEECGKTLVPEIERAANAVQTLISESQDIVAALSDELQEDLKNHHEGLQIIGRMLERLISPGERLKKLAEDREISGELTVMAEDQWRILLEGVTEKELALKKIQVTLKNIGKENYKIVSMSNELVKNRKNQLLSFLEKQVLPILDGIYDGQKHLAPRIEELQQHYTEQSSELDAWFEIYGKLGEELEQVLEQVDVHEIEVVPGIPIDFERHEPFAVESDPEMENEQIKEVARKGYEYTTQCGERQVLRAAQVVVVKNEN